ncbi:MAG: hypothetical protein AAF614_15805 [Chloroflexota bacterium]
MMKQLAVALFFLFLIGCTSPTVKNENVAATIVVPTPITAQSNDTPTIAPTTEPTPPANSVPEPTAVSETGVPVFFNLRFATAPEGSPTAVFPGGTEQIFALWDFAHIPADAKMRRVWRFNGEAWLDREEDWDVSEYGQDGTMTAVSIYDFEGGGLLLGDYEVDLYLNDRFILSGRFFIQSEETAVSAAGPAGQTMTAVNSTELTLISQDGRLFQSVNTDHPITEIVWLPSGNQVVFVTQDASERIEGSTLGIKHGLWLYELGTFEAVPLGFYDEDFHEVGVSHNGRYLSLIAGSGYGDACGIDRAFYIMQLNDAGQRTNLYELTQFNGVPRGQTGYMHNFYPANSGEWTSAEQLTLEINATCLTEETIAELDIASPGIYQIDVPQLTATRISSSPTE